jgi:hypothetical protein
MKGEGRGRRIEEMLEPGGKMRVISFYKNSKRWGVRSCAINRGINLNNG